MGAQRAEVDVPQPGHVAAVGVVVVDDDDDHIGGSGVERAQRLPEAGRVLDQLEHDVAAVHVEPLAPTEGGRHRGQTSGRSSRLEAEAERERGGAGRVLRVVRTFGAQLDIDLIGVDAHAQPLVGTARQAQQLGAGRQRGTVHRAAVQLLVGGKQLPQFGRDAVPAHLGAGARAQCRDPLVVAVEHDVAGRGRGDPAEQGCGRVDLAEAVELVTHDVQQQRPLRRHGRGEAHRPRLVEFEHGDVVRQSSGPGGVLDARGDRTTDEVAARVVGQHPITLGQDRRDHLRRGGLAVRPGHHHDAFGQPGHRPGEVAGDQLLDDQPGQRVAPAAQQPQQRRG